MTLDRKSIVGFSAENDHVMNLSQSTARSQSREKGLTGHGFGASEIDTKMPKRQHVIGSVNERAVQACPITSIGVGSMQRGPIRGGGYSLGTSGGVLSSCLQFNGVRFCQCLGLSVEALCFHCPEAPPGL